MTRPRVLLADDHRLSREAFSQLLTPECEVIGSVGDGRAVLTECPRPQPDIVVMDVAMPPLNGLDATRQIRLAMPQVKVIILTTSKDTDIAAAAFRAGASAFLRKNSAADELPTAVREVSRGRSYVSPLATQGLLENLLHPPAPVAKAADLSPRRSEILQRLPWGTP